MINPENTKRWPLWVALGTTCLVLIISLLNKVSLILVLWRGLVAFVVMYALVTGSLFLFKCSSEPQDTKEKPKSVEKGPRTEVGKLFDQTVGDKDEEAAAVKAAAGQINDGLTASNIDTKQQAEILRKMGWSTEDKANG